MAVCGNGPAPAIPDRRNTPRLSPLPQHGPILAAIEAAGPIDSPRLTTGRRGPMSGCVSMSRP